MNSVSRSELISMTNIFIMEKYKTKNLNYIIFKNSHKSSFQFILTMWSAHIMQILSLLSRTSLPSPFKKYMLMLLVLYVMYTESFGGDTLEGHNTTSCEPCWWWNILNVVRAGGGWRGCWELGLSWNEVPVVLGKHSGADTIHWISWGCVGLRLQRASMHTWPLLSRMVTFTVCWQWRRLFGCGPGWERRGWMWADEGDVDGGCGWHCRCDGSPCWLHGAPRATLSGLLSGLHGLLNWYVWGLLWIDT